MKRCSNKDCIHGNEFQDDGNFHKCPSSRDGLYKWCKDCKHKYDKIWLTKKLNSDPYYQRKNHLKRLYGISLEDFNDMVIDQNNRCGGCGMVFTKDNKPFVHHNHETGKVIGLWHCNCNFAEGYMKTSDIAFKIAEAMQREEIKCSLLDGR